MKSIVVNIQLNVPDNISSSMIDAYFMDLERNVNNFLADELADDNINIDVLRVYEE